MRCGACACPRYEPDEELVCEDWRLRLAPADWDASYFDAHETCAACGHAPAAHAAEAAEAAVVSAAHLADHGAAACSGGGSDGNAVVVVKTVSLAAADPADPALRAVDRLSARGADEPSPPPPPPPPPPRTPVALAPIDLICRIESCFTDVGLQLWRCSVLLAEFMASWGRAGATAACRRTGGAGVVWEVGAGVALPSLAAAALGETVWVTDVNERVLDNAEEEVALLRKRCGDGGGGGGGGGGGDEGGVKASVKAFDFTWGDRGEAVRDARRGWVPEDADASVRCIVAADVVFADDVTTRLLTFLSRHLRGRGGGRNADVCYLAYDRRSGQTMTDVGHPVDYFFASLAKHGLQAVVVPSQSIPSTCSVVERSPDSAVAVVTLLPEVCAA